MSDNPYTPPLASPPPLPTFPPPLSKTPWNGWWTLLWAVILFLASQLIMTIGISIAMFIDGIPDLDPKKIEASLLALSTDGDVLGLISFVTIFFICPACWFIGKARPGWSGWDYLGNTKTKWWHWPVWGAATIACSFIFGFIGPHLGIDGPDKSMVAMGQSTQYPILLYLGVAIGAPLVEEFIFRGAVWRGWCASRLALPGTLLLTSAFWAILHLQYPPVIIAYIFCLGLVLGLAREKTGNLWVPVWMHALNNGLATHDMLNL